MKKTRDELKDLRQFGMVLAGILAVFGAIHYIKHHLLPAQWLAGVGLVILCIGLLAPRLLKPIYAIFLKAAHVIGWFNTRVILILIYFLLVTPIAIIMKIVRKDPLDRKIEEDALTYWIKKSAPKAVKEHLEKQF